MQRWARSGTITAAAGRPVRDRRHAAAPRAAAILPAALAAAINAAMAMALPTIYSEGPSHRPGAMSLRHPIALLDWTGRLPMRKKRPDGKGRIADPSGYVIAQHFLYFFPDPQGQGSLRPILCDTAGCGMTRRSPTLFIVW